MVGGHHVGRPAGGQSVYSRLAIETGMTLRLAFHLALRQIEGLMASAGCATQHA